MTFNYSASLRTIAKNLGVLITTDIISKAAKGEDTKLLDALLKMGLGYVKEGSTTFTVFANTGEITKFVRNNPPSLLRYKVGSGSPVKFVEESQKAYENIYGSAVRTAFEENFKPYIEFQDTLNDAFKVTFRLFEKELIKELYSIQESKDTITEKDYRDIITKLWEKFPAIKGPLTRAGFDVIPVVGVGTTSREDISGRNSAQSHFKSVVSGKEEQERHSVKALIKHLEESSKSGSVLPFHYIDGAELGITLNNMHEAYGDTFGITPIHDAMMVPVSLFDESVWEYNKATVDVNKNYSIAESLVEMVKKWKYIDTRVNGKRKKAEPGDEAKDTGVIDNVKGLNATKGKEDKDPFDVMHEIQNAVLERGKEISEARKTLFGKLKGIIFNNMVGTPGGYYQEGVEGPSESYLEKVKSQYTSVTVPPFTKKTLEGKPEEKLQRKSGQPLASTDQQLYSILKARLKEMYPEIDLNELPEVFTEDGESVLGKAVGKAVFISDRASIDTLPHEYAHIYINLLRHTPFVQKAIKHVMEKFKVDAVEAEEILVQHMGEKYVQWVKEGKPSSNPEQEIDASTAQGKANLAKQKVSGIMRKLGKAVEWLWNNILGVFSDKHMKKSIVELDILADRFYSGITRDAIRFGPEKGFSKVDTEATIKSQPLAADILSTVTGLLPDRATFTGSAALATQGDVYRKGANGVVDLHDLDIVMESKEDIDYVSKELAEKFGITKIYSFVLGKSASGAVLNTIKSKLSSKLAQEERHIHTYIVVDKGYKVTNMKRYGDTPLGRVESYDITDSTGTVVGTYKAEIKRVGFFRTKIVREDTTGYKAVLLDLMGNPSTEAVTYYSEALGKSIRVATAEEIFEAKNAIGYNVPRDKDVNDFHNFYHTHASVENIIGNLPSALQSRVNSIIQSTGFADIESLLKGC